MLSRPPKSANSQQAKADQDGQDTGDIVDLSFLLLLKEMPGLNAPTNKKQSKRLQVLPGKNIAHYSGITQHDEDDPIGGIQQSSEEVDAALGDVDTAQIPDQRGASYPMTTSSSNVISNK